MNHFHFRRGRFWAEGVSLSRIAESVGTPVYVYSTATIDRHVAVVQRAFRHRQPLICYAVKANSTLAILKRFVDWQVGFDIVSGGELERVLKVGGDAKKIVFSGVGKREDELTAALRSGILMINVESAEELRAIDRLGRRLKLKAPIALRVNPDVDPKTHPAIATGLKTSKFGVAFDEAVSLYRSAKQMKGVVARGIDCHIGSQLTNVRPLREAVVKIAGLIQQLGREGHQISHVDVGGGLGIRYHRENPPTLAAYSRAICEPLSAIDATLIVEPGRVLVGNAGVLLTRVLYRKQSAKKRLVIVDAGMNDLLRPALYDAHHEIVAVAPRSPHREICDVVGPVCESSDVLGRRRRLPPLDAGDLLAIQSAGAYGMSMSSTYNSRPRPAEVLVDGSKFRIIRRRESIDDLWRGECV